MSSGYLNSLGVNMATNNDPFEEFEFRPLNEGLGFHRQDKKQTSAQNTSTTEVRKSLSNQSQNSSFSTPLPRHDMRPDTGVKKSYTVPTIEDDSIAKAQTAVNEILKNLNQKRQFDFITDTEKQKMILKKSKPFFFAATLDAMLISACFLLTMIIMLTITKVDLFMNLTHPESSRFIYLATIALFGSVTFIYMVINRAFTGSTPGEWAFDQRCGSVDDMNTISYIPRLALRTLVVMTTGFILLPTLSYLLNKDIAGTMSGISLLRKPNV